MCFPFEIAISYQRFPNKASGLSEVMLETAVK